MLQLYGEICGDSAQRHPATGSGWAMTMAGLAGTTGACPDAGRETRSKRKSDAGRRKSGRLRMLMGGEGATEQPRIHLAHTSYHS